MEVPKQLEDMQRVLEAWGKEFYCRHRIVQVTEDDGLGFDEVVKGIVDIIPSGYQHPEITCTRAIFNGNEFKTSNLFNETNLP